jgi:DNA mismatch repair ATPase MutS
MLGFTDKALDKFRSLLLNAGWTLVIVSEQSSPSKTRTRTLRAITEIVSGATHEDNVESSYTLAAVYVEPIPSNRSVRYYSMGVATLNTATGKASLHEITETKAHSADYLNRLLLSFDPNEILWNQEAADLFELSSYRTRLT